MVAHKSVSYRLNRCYLSIGRYVYRLQAGILVILQFPVTEVNMTSNYAIRINCDAAIVSKAIALYPIIIIPFNS